MPCRQQNTSSSSDDSVPCRPGCVSLTAAAALRESAARHGGRGAFVCVSAGRATFAQCSAGRGSAVPSCFLGWRQGRGLLGSGVCGCQGPRLVPCNRPEAPRCCARPERHCTFGVLVFSCVLLCPYPVHSSDLVPAEAGESGLLPRHHLKIHQQNTFSLASDQPSCCSLSSGGQYQHIGRSQTASAVAWCPQQGAHGTPGAR